MTTTTLATAYATASTYWDAKGPSSRMMSIRAWECIKLLGQHPSEGGEEAMMGRPVENMLRPGTGALLLTLLRHRGLGKSTVASYYQAFRRMLALSGVATTAWPSPGPIPRKVREAMTERDIHRLCWWLVDHGWADTANLLQVLRGTGMRVEVEALSWTAWRLEVIHETPEVWVVGKGGHERRIPVSNSALTLMGDHERMANMRRTPYTTHLSRWSQGVAALGITTKKPTPHAVRHWYATQAYARTKDLKAVQELLGHADPGTTAKYIGVDMEALSRAAGISAEGGDGIFPGPPGPGDTVRTDVTFAHQGLHAGEDS